MCASQSKQSHCNIYSFYWFCSSRGPCPIQFRATRSVLKVAVRSCFCTDWVPGRQQALYCSAQAHSSGQLLQSLPDLGRDCLLSLAVDSGKWHFPSNPGEPRTELLGICPGGCPLFLPRLHPHLENNKCSVFHLGSLTRSNPFLSTPKGQLQRNMKIKDKNCFFRPSWETDDL